MSQYSAHPRSLRARLVEPLVILAGGLIGSAGRGVVTLLAPAAPSRFPVSTLIVNLVGSFLLGWFLARRERAVTGRWSFRFWAIGALGSFTTFSAFSLEVFRLLEFGRIIPAVAYVAASTVGGLTAALAGERLGSR